MYDSGSVPRKLSSLLVRPCHITLDNRVYGQDSEATGPHPRTLDLFREVAAGMIRARAGTRTKSLGLDP